MIEYTEKTCNEFLKEMAEAGFNFTFKASNDKDEYYGQCVDGVIKAKRKLSKEELIKRIEISLLENKK